MAKPTTSLKSGLRKRPELDRRVTVRYASNHQGRCSSPSAGDVPCWSAKVRDVSTRGIGLIFNCMLSPGTPLTVEIDSPDQEIALKLPARVIHATPLSPEEWLVGCAFLHWLTDAELQGLLAFIS